MKSRIIDPSEHESVHLALDRAPILLGESATTDGSARTVRDHTVHLLKRHADSRVDEAIFAGYEMLLLGQVRVGTPVLLLKLRIENIRCNLMGSGTVAHPEFNDHCLEPDPMPRDKLLGEASHTIDYKSGWVQNDDCQVGHGEYGRLVFVCANEPATRPEG